ncbi:hypothetical protein EYF80_066702 [Liparis tanakae]|uniref:Uncharacterized protein n=1 Tax=Liparis tanakae TaxID=230148 RepID=A0A4Z2E3P6_9TELE|nr:hypothetical protein EYF80_066702 [Liparis tanakae]
MMEESGIETTPPASPTAMSAAAAPPPMTRDGGREEEWAESQQWAESQRGQMKCFLLLLSCVTHVAFPRGVASQPVAV